VRYGHWIQAKYTEATFTKYGCLLRQAT